MFGCFAVAGGQLENRKYTQTRPLERPSRNLPFAKVFRGAVMGKIGGNALVILKTHDLLLHGVLQILIVVIPGKIHPFVWIFTVVV